MKPCVEGLEDRLVPSASASALPPVAAMTSWTQGLLTLENDVSNAEQAVHQEIAQFMAFVQQQWDHLLGIDTNAPHSTPNAVVPQSNNSLSNSNNSSNPNPGPIASPENVLSR